MPISGDVVDIESGTPEGREGGFRHPALLVTAQRILGAGPSVVHVVPLTTAIRRFHPEIVLEPDEANGLDDVSAVQCEHIRAVSPRRIVATRGNIGAASLAQVRQMMAVILDMP